MQAISIILVAVLLFLADPPRVSSRIPRDGVDPRTQEEEETTESPEARTISEVDLYEQNESEQSRTSQDEDDPGIVGTGAPPCNNPYGCPKEKQEAEMDDAEYRRLRIEVIKETILQKLRLKSPPQVKLNRRGLPSVLLSNSESLLPSSSETLDESQSRNANFRAPPTATKDDAFYGTTKNVFVFPDNSSSSLIKCSEQASLCLVFRLDPEVSLDTLASSRLWLYNKALPTSAHGVPVVSNQTLAVSEISYDSQSGLIRKQNLPLEEDDVELSPGEWLHVRVDKVVQRWIIEPHIMHALEISFKSCENNSAPYSPAGDQRSFLVLSLKRLPSLSRSRRSVNCRNTTSQCCKESLYLNFKDIGWDEWIIAPRGFHVNYCRGTCVGANSTGTNHATILSSYVQNRKANNEKPPFSLCCAPSKMEALNLMYLSKPNELTTTTLSNMIVKSCHCA